MSSDSPETVNIKRYNPRHVVHPSHLSLQECLAISDVVISAVPSASYKVKTEWLKDGCICVNVAADKNFEKNVQDKVGNGFSIVLPAESLVVSTGLYLHSCCWQSDNTYALEKFVGLMVHHLP